MFQLDDSKSLHKKWWFHHFHPLKHGCLGYQAELFRITSQLLLYFHGFAHPAKEREFAIFLVLFFFHQILEKNPFFFCATPKKFFTAKTTLLQSHQNLPPKMTQQRISDSERPRNRSKLTQVLVERRHLW